MGTKKNCAFSSSSALGISRNKAERRDRAHARRLRLPNTDEGHSKLEEIAAGREALVCFEATGGHEWRLWASMAAAGIEARQLAPAQAEAFGRSRGTLAKTDRIDAELIARFMAFRPEAGRRLPSGKLRDLRAPATKRKQLVEMRKSARQQAKANLKNGTAEPVEDLSGELLELLERQVAEVEERIGSLLANDAVLAETAAVLRSIPGTGPVVCAMPVAEMPELGRISGEQAAALAGLAPVARDSGQMRGKRMIGGRRAQSLFHDFSPSYGFQDCGILICAFRSERSQQVQKISRSIRNRALKHSGRFRVSVAVERALKLSVG